MTLTVKRKKETAIYKAIPAFINLWNDKTFMVEEYGIEVMRNMCDYDIYIKPHDVWLDLSYAEEEGFLDSKELKKWP